MRIWKIVNIYIYILLNCNINIKCAVIAFHDSYSNMKSNELYNKCKECLDENEWNIIQNKKDETFKHFSYKKL